MDEKKNDVEELTEILTSLKPDVDFENSTALIDDGSLDSFDIFSIVSELSDHYDISIPASEIVPGNFNSAEDLSAMVKRLREEWGTTGR